MKTVEKIMTLVRQAGKIMLDADRSSLGIASKEGKGNFVTEYDKKVQDFLYKGLMEILPEAEFVGEEGEKDEAAFKGYTFIVDPIDGTANFVRDNHASAISVGVLYDGEPHMGVVYNPYLDEMYYGKAGEGAFLNGKPIRVSDEPLENGIILFGTAPYYKELSEQTFRIMYDYFKTGLDLRRSGSAALDLCSIAAGRAELFFEVILSPWDYAAAALILKEAGGIITAIDGSTLRFDDRCSVLAKNRED